MPRPQPIMGRIPSGPRQISRFRIVPVLTTANIMLTALRLSQKSQSDPDDCMRQILRNLGQAKEAMPEDMDALRQRVEEAYLDLSIAGLLDPDQHGRFTLTRRGRQVLRDHPMGVDSSVLEEFPEYLHYLRWQGSAANRETELSSVHEPQASYFLGYTAHRSGRDLSENPYDPDTISHLEWENGWSEANKEAEADKD